MDIKELSTKISQISKTYGVEIKHSKILDIVSTTIHKMDWVHLNAELPNLIYENKPFYAVLVNIEMDNQTFSSKAKAYLSETHYQIISGKKQHFIQFTQENKMYEFIIALLSFHKNQIQSIKYKTQKDEWEIKNDSEINHAVDIFMLIKRYEALIQSEQEKKSFYEKIHLKKQPVYEFIEKFEVIYQEKERSLKKYHPLFKTDKGVNMYYARKKLGDLENYKNSDMVSTDSRSRTGKTTFFPILNIFALAKEMEKYSCNKTYDIISETMGYKNWEELVDTQAENVFNIIKNTSNNMFMISFNSVENRKQTEKYLHSFFKMKTKFKNEIWYFSKLYMSKIKFISGGKNMLILDGNECENNAERTHFSMLRYYVFNFCLKNKPKIQKLMVKLTNSPEKIFDFQTNLFPINAIEYFNLYTQLYDNKKISVEQNQIILKYGKHEIFFDGEKSAIEDIQEYLSIFRGVGDPCRALYTSETERSIELLSQKIKDTHSPHDNADEYMDKIWSFIFNIPEIEIINDATKIVKIKR